jgi:lysozyme family protein
MHEFVMLSEEKARRYYLAEYVVGPGFQPLPEPLRSLMVDYGVISGPATATKVLQGLLGVDVDGILGPKTRAAIAAHQNQRALYLQLVEARALRHLDLALADSATRAFLKANKTVNLHNARGWMRRALSFLHAA